MKALKVALMVLACAAIPIAQAQVQQPAISVTAQNIGQIPSDTSLEQLIAIMQVEKSIEAQFLQVSSSTDEALMKNIFGDQLSSLQLSKNQQQELSKVMADFGKKSIDALNTPEYRHQLLKLYRDTYKEIYTQQEVDAMIAFYRSSIGQSIASKQAIFDAKFTKKVTPIAVEHQRQAVNTLLPELMQKIDKIVKSAKK